MRLAKKTSVLVLMFSLSVLLVSNARAAAILADSLADYSLVQGQGGWYYGYYTPETDMDFHLMHLGGTGWLGTETWVVDEEKSWAMIMADSVHSHGPNFSRGSDTTTLSTRRWVSDLAGVVEVTGTLAKRSPYGGDGVEGFVMVDGSAVWQQEVAFNDMTGLGFSLTIPVEIGSTIDFALDPRRNSLYDTSRFSSRISLIGFDEPGTPDGPGGVIPEPATLSLLGIGGLALVARRKLAKRG